MAIFNGFSHINGILMAFLCFLMAIEYSSGNQWTDFDETWYVALGTPVYNSLFK